LILLIRVIEKNLNIFVQNGEAKININCLQNTRASSCQLSSNTESSSKQSDGPSSSCGQVQWAGINGWYKILFKIYFWFSINGIK